MPERSFGRTVRYRRTRLGLSQAQLGELVGRAPSTVRSWERDKSVPNETSVLHALAAILGVDERSLFEKAGQEPPPAAETSPTVEEALATLRPVGERKETHSKEVEDELQDSPATTDESESDVVPSPASGEVGELEQFSFSFELEEDEGSRFDSEPSTSKALDSDPRPGHVAPPEPYGITPPTPPIVEPSYMEDQSQRQLYRVRSLATLVVAVALLVALLWAVSESLDALVSWWDELFGSLRL